MTNRIVVLSLLLAGSFCFLGSIQLGKGMLESHQQFGSWTQDLKREYGSIFEYLYRLSIFHANRLKIDAHNAGNHSFTMGINKFADLTSDEFMARYTTKFPVPTPSMQSEIGTSASKESQSQDVKLDNEVNWVEKGMVNPIRDQGLCGSCYAFASIAAIESAYAIANGKLLKFSEQQIVNCGHDFSNILGGCNGGFMIPVFDMAITNGVFDLEKIPYQEEQQSCDSSIQPFVNLKSYTKLSPITMKALLGEIMVGPVAIDVEVTPIYQFYKSGVMNNKAPCGFFPNHAVTAVGYKTDTDIPYLLIRNSWSESWGEGGYFKHSIGDLDSTGTCGIADVHAARPSFV